MFFFLLSFFEFLFLRLLEFLQFFFPSLQFLISFQDFVKFSYFYSHQIRRWCRHSRSVRSRVITSPYASWSSHRRSSSALCFAKDFRHFGRDVLLRSWFRSLMNNITHASPGFLKLASQYFYFTLDWRFGCRRSNGRIGWRSFHSSREESFLEVWWTEARLETWESRRRFSRSPLTVDSTHWRSRTK